MTSVMYGAIGGPAEACLIRQILDGRRDLFADLLAPHLPPLQSVVRATAGSYSEIDDIIQQTALQALAHLHQFRFEASFRTWLIRIGINEARQWRRRSNSSKCVTVDLTTVPELPATDRSVSPLAQYQTRENMVRVRAAIAGLPEKYRFVIILKDLEELTLSEVARRLGLTLAAVKARHLRGRRRLAKSLARSSESKSRSPVYRC